MCPLLEEKRRTATADVRLFHDPPNGSHRGDHLKLTEGIWTQQAPLPSEPLQYTTVVLVDLGA